MATKVGSIYIDIAAKLATLERDLKTANRLTQTHADRMASAFGVVQRRIDSIGASFSRLGALFGVGIAVSAIERIGARALDTGDRIKALSERAGIGAERFQELSFAASQYGVSQDEIAAGLQTFATRFAEFIQTTKGPGADAFAGLKIGAKDTQGALDEFIAKVGRVGDAQTRARFLILAFGKAAGPQLKALIGDGAASLELLKQKAHDLGLVLSSDAIDRLDEAGDKLAVLKQVLDAQFASAVAALAPDISKPVDSLTSDPEAIRRTAAAIGDVVKVLKALTFSPHRKLLGVLIDLLAPTDLTRLSQLNDEIARLQQSLSAPLQIPARKFASEQLLASATAERDALLARLHPPTATPAGGAPPSANDPFLPADTEAKQAAEKAAAALSVSIEKEIAALELEAASIYKSAAAAKGYAISLEGLDAAQQARVDTAVRTLEIDQQAQAAIQETVGWIDELTASEDAYKDSLYDAAQALKDEQDPLRAVNREVELAQELYAKHLITLDEYQHKLLDIGDAFDKTDPPASKLEDAGRDLGLTFQSAFEDAIVEGNKFRDVLDGIYKDILRIAIRKAITEPLADGIAGLFKPAAASAPAVAQSAPALRRPASSAATNTAFAARADLGGARGGNTEVHVHNTSGEPSSVKHRQTPQGERIDVLIGRAVAQDMATKGPGYQAIKQRFALSDARQRR